MKPPPDPDDERSRLDSLDRLEILDTPAEERFDRITRLTQRVLGVPIALVSLVDRDRQWFKSAQGLAAPETPREVSFCGHAILGGKTMVVGDASSDERFADNPLVTGDPGIRFYAGRPLRAPDGSRVGTLCVIDSRPRDLSAQDHESLDDLAALVEGELRAVRLGETERSLRAELQAAERRASIDSLTRTWNRRFIEELVRRELTRAGRRGTPLAVALLDVDDFKRVNDTLGHQAGDEVLREVAERMRAAVRPYDAVGRYGGEEFLALLTESDGDTAGQVAERIIGGIAGRPMETRRGGVPVTASVGVALYPGRGGVEAESLVAAADRALYRAKAGGKNQMAFAPLED